VLILGKGYAVGVLGGWRVTLGSSNGRWWWWVAGEVLAEGRGRQRKIGRHMHNRGGGFREKWRERE